MRIEQLPELPGSATEVDVPCSYNGADFKLPLDPNGGYRPDYEIGYVEDDSARADFSLNNNGYASITPPSSGPNAFPTGAKLISVGAIVWTSGNWLAIVPYSNNYAYVVGPASATIKGLRCRWWYYRVITT